VALASDTINLYPKEVVADGKVATVLLVGNTAVFTVLSHSDAMVVPDTKIVLAI